MLRKKRTYVISTLCIIAIVIPVVVWQASFKIHYDPAPQEYMQPNLEVVKNANELVNKSCRINFSYPNHASTDPHFLTPIDVIEHSNSLFHNLPIPTLTGYVFAGWYISPNFKEDERINGSKMVVCDEKTPEINLYGKWITRDEYNKTKPKGVPILLFHQFDDECATDNLENCLPFATFESMVKYISENNYYLPTWEELKAYIDKNLSLPEKSVIITDDDGANSWFEKAEPILEKYNVIATSFLITKDKSFENISLNPRVFYRSHSDSLHSLSKKNPQKAVIHETSFNDQLIDFERSRRKLGSVGQVFAFPFGQYDKILTNKALELAGFSMAVTVDDGRVLPGSNPYRLPRVYIFNKTTLDDLKSVL